MAHELQIMPKSKKAPQEKPQEPSSPTKSHALSSQQEKMLSRMATHGSSSEDDGDDGDDEDSSSDEEFESMVAEYVKKIFKYVKKVNMYVYNVHLREGRHHQHIKFTKIEHKPKKKVVKERRPRQEATIVIREWTSGGQSSSSSSSDELQWSCAVCGSPEHPTQGSSSLEAMTVAARPPLLAHGGRSCLGDEMRRRWIGMGGNEWMGMSERLPLEKRRGLAWPRGKWRASVRCIERPSRSIAPNKNARCGL
jgi:hypothetical protein